MTVRFLCSHCRIDPFFFMMFSFISLAIVVHQVWFAEHNSVHAALLRESTLINWPTTA